jgi:hypothetical protein
MSEEKSSFAKNVEDLVSKSIEANKVFLSEGTRLVKQFTDPTAKKENINLFQPELVTNAFNAFAKLNIEYLKGLIDLGLSVTKQAGTQATDNAPSSANTDAGPGPAFVLQSDAMAGSRVTLQFLLDNVKKEPVLCQFVNTAYQLQADATQNQEFKTDFSPQNFTMEPGDSKTISIVVSIPANTAAGSYSSNVQVKGFEPVFFSIVLNVTQQQTKKQVHGSRKGK